jgi:hypothetical protein
MTRVMATWWFLVSTAVCCGLAAAFTSWLAADSSAGARVLAVLLGLATGLAVMLLVAWAVASDEPPVASEPVLEPVLPAAEPAPTVAVASPAPEPPAAVEALTGRLDEGAALRALLAPGAADDRVGMWIEEAHRDIAAHRPGALGYFDALAGRPYADDFDRLDAHLARLGTVVRDFL